MGFCLGEKGVGCVFRVRLVGVRFWSLLTCVVDCVWLVVLFERAKSSFWKAVGGVLLGSVAV